MRRGIETFRLPADWDAKNPDHVDLLNRILVQAQQRLDTIQSIGATQPKAPQTVTATGRQGCIWLTWQRVVNADGYTVIVASESTMTKLVGRHSLPDSDSCTYQLPVGNVASQFWFQVFSYRGNQLSPPSPTVTATSATYGAGESAPPTPPNDPRNPLNAGVTGGQNRP